MTSHAAVVARGWGKPCVCGLDVLEVRFRAWGFALRLQRRLQPGFCRQASNLLGLMCVHLSRSLTHPLTCRMCTTLLPSFIPSGGLHRQDGDPEGHGAARGRLAVPQRLHRRGAERQAAREGARAQRWVGLEVAAMLAV